MHLIVFASKSSSLSGSLVTAWWIPWMKAKQISGGETLTRFPFPAIGSSLFFTAMTISIGTVAGFVKWYWTSAAIAAEFSGTAAAGLCVSDSPLPKEIAGRLVVASLRE